MAKFAQPHSHLSNRAKARSALQHKAVFKSVLQNPFQISWPSVPANVQNVVLARLVGALENIPLCAHPSRKGSHKTGYPQGNVDIPEDVEYDNIQINAPRALGRACADSPLRLVIGINEVTRALQLQLSLARKYVVDHPSDQPPSHPTPSPIVVVFVCCADVDPTALIDHVPYLVAGCNSPRNAAQLVRLVPLPKGSESTISQILGIRRAAVVAFRHGSPLFETVQDILGTVPVISAPWLCPSISQGIQQLVPACIKQLRTTAPRDMKVAKEQRSKARVTAKKRAPSSMRRKSRMTLTGSESVA